MQLAAAVPPRRPGTPRGAALAVLAVIVTALLAGAGAFTVVGSTWQSRAVVTVVPPQTGTGSHLGENPLLRLDYDLPQFVTVLSTAMSTPSARATLRRQGGTGAVTIDTGTGLSTSAAISPTPQLRFTARAASADAAQHTAAALVSVARDQLDRVQTRAGVPGAARATILVLEAQSTAVRNDDARWTAASRTALAVAVLLGAGCYLTVRRRPRR